MAEDPNNIDMLCPKHAPKPNPEFANMPLEFFKGRNVKLGFHHGKLGGVEHMWVECLGIATDAEEELCGLLNSDPVYAELVCGDMVLFDRSEIEDLYEVEDN